MSTKTKVLIIEARFYDDISDELAKGATQALDAEDVDYDIVTVPGALEIPAVIVMAENSDEIYDGYIALGCVIRGETSHYDIVAGESARALMDLTLQGIAIGNGILTTENKDQAMVRAGVNKKNKGAFAANACLTMIGMQNHFGLME